MSVPVLVVFALLVTMADTTVSIHDVVLVSASTNYSGPCPAKIPVTLSLDGDPQTIFRWQVVGDVVTPTKRSYGFVPPEGSVSVNVDIPVDAPQVGSHYLQAVVTYGTAPLSQNLNQTVESDKLPYSVMCASPAAAPSSTPSMQRGSKASAQ